MIKVVITGGDGFIGKHIIFSLLRNPEKYSWVIISKHDFSSKKKLEEKLKDCDVIVHLAGLNKGEEKEIYETNIDLTKSIINGCEDISIKPQIVFMSSTHNTRDTAYGKSKKDSEALFAEWSKMSGGKATSIVSPNIFGEFAKPFYNTFVSTFCQELISGKLSEVNPVGEVELLYVKDLAEIVLRVIDGDIKLSEVFPKGQKVNVLEVYNKLKQYKEKYDLGIVPELKTKIDIQLFNTYRSFIHPDFFRRKIELKSDNRGYLFEIIKSENGGQSFFSSTLPGITRGNHYHTRKVERFCVVSGEAVIRLRRILSSEIIEYKVSGSEPVFVDMPTYYTHSIENTGDTALLTLFWTNEFFNSEDTDTFMENVII